MLSAVTGFLHRRRKALAVTAVGSVSAYLLGKYAQWKMEELAERAELDRIARQNLRRRFEQNQQDCTLTVLSLLPSLAEYLFEKMNVERLTEQLKAARHRTNATNATTTNNATASPEAQPSPSEEKQAAASSPTPADEALQQRQAQLEMWEQLKIYSFARTMTSVYAMALVTILIRIQLNLIGRQTYLDSVETLEKPGNNNNSALVRPAVSFEVERKFLALSWYFLHQGLAQVRAVVEESVRQVLGKIPLSTKYSQEEILQCLHQVRQRVETEDPESPEDLRQCFRDALLPSEDGADASIVQSGITMATEQIPASQVTITLEPELVALIREFRDYLDSPNFSSVLKLCLDAGFARMDQMYTSLFPVSTPSAVNATTEGSSASKIVELPAEQEGIPAKPSVRPLASLLPETSRQAHTILHAQPNPYVKDMESVPALQAFAAIIYAAHESVA